MRKFAKISAVLAAMVLALAFVGCKDDDDDDDDPSVVTAWYSAEDGATETVYFYDDSTFKLEATMNKVTMVGATGTYSSGTTKDGEIVITYDDGETGTAVIKTESGKTYLKWDYETYSKQ